MPKTDDRAKLKLQDTEAWGDDSVWIHDVGVPEETERRVSVVGKQNGICGVGRGNTFSNAVAAAYSSYQLRTAPVTRRELYRNILSDHQFTLVNHSSIGPQHHCGCGERPASWHEWAEHVATILEKA